VKQDRKESATNRRELAGDRKESATPKTSARPREVRQDLKNRRYHRGAARGARLAQDRRDRPKRARRARIAGSAAGSEGRTRGQAGKKDSTKN